MSIHPNTRFPVIIPEINSTSAICDYLAQTSKVLSRKKIPTYVFFINFPKKLFQANYISINSHLTHIFPVQIFPFNRFIIVQKINIYLSFNLLFLYILFRHHLRPWYWLFYPQIIELINFSLPPKITLYDIVDSYNCPIKYKISTLKKANTVTAISTNLISEYQKISPTTIIHLVPQGFSLIKSKSNFLPLNKIRQIKNKIGFIGGINNRFDYNLLFGIISNNPTFNFIFVGPTATDINVSPKQVDKLNRQLFSYPNVYYLGPANKNQIQKIINFFDIAIIPYDIRDQFNRLCYPMKIFEYFACQKPVISTSIEELKQFPSLVKIGNTVSEWQNHLDYLFSHPLTSVQKKKSTTLAYQNSWNNKIKKILKILPH